MKDNPWYSVHVTGKKGSYLVHDLKEWKEGDRFGLRSPGTGMSAIDMNLWMVNNKIQDALTLKDSKMANIDWKKLVTYAVVGIVAFYVIMAFVK